MRRSVLLYVLLLLGAYMYVLKILYSTSTGSKILQDFGIDSSKSRWNFHLFQLNTTDKFIITTTVHKPTTYIVVEFEKCLCLTTTFSLFLKIISRVIFLRNLIQVNLHPYGSAAMLTLLMHGWVCTLTA